MSVSAEDLQAGLAAINAADGVSDEAKQTMAQALASDFAEDVPADDPAVDDAVNDAGMTDAYAAASEDEKKELRARFARLLTKQRAKAFAAAKPVAKKPASTGFFAADLKAAVQEAVTKALPPSGRVAAPAANPTGPRSSVADPTGFSTKIKANQATNNCSFGKALLLTKGADPKGFNEWTKAGQPGRE